MSKSKSWVKVSALLLALLFITTSLAACGQKSETKAAQSTEVKADTSTAAAVPPNPVSDKPVEISVLITERPDAPWSNDMPVLKELEKRTNVKFKFELMPLANEDDKFNLTMATGSIPDMIVFKPQLMTTYASTGLYEPLNDLIAQNAPNVKKVIIDNPIIKREIADAEGKIYYMPQLPAIKTKVLFFLRQDWLDKLSLKTPETLDDWYNMMKALKEGDPNGNSKKDEVPFTVRIGNGKRDNLISFMEPFGVYNDDFYEDGGVVKFGPIEPKMKEALTWISKCVKDGLIDKEYGLNDVKAWESKLNNSISGITFDWSTRIDRFNNDTGKITPTAKYQAVLPPLGTNGQRATKKGMEAIRNEGAVAISVKSAFKTEIVKLVNYLYSEEGSNLVNFGIEGQHYTSLTKDSVTYSDLIAKDEKGMQVALYNQGIARSLPYQQDLRYESALASDNTRKARALYEPIIKDIYPKALPYTQADRDIRSSKYNDIKNYCDEMLDKFILGVEPMEKFDSFVQNVKSMGIDEVIKVEQAAYDRYLNAGK